MWCSLQVFLLMPFMQLKDLLRWFDHTWAEFEFRSVHNSICNIMYSDGMQYVDLCIMDSDTVLLCTTCMHSMTLPCAYFQHEGLQTSAIHTCMCTLRTCIYTCHSCKHSWHILVGSVQWLGTAVNHIQYIQYRHLCVHVSCVSGHGTTSLCVDKYGFCVYSFHGLLSTWHASVLSLVKAFSWTLDVCTFWRH